MLGFLWNNILIFLPFFLLLLFLLPDLLLILILIQDVLLLNFIIVNQNLFYIFEEIALD